jgi:thiamine biosynthesis lipoprotein
MRKTIVLILLLFTAEINAQESYRERCVLMGCDFEITVVAGDSLEAEHFIGMAKSEISRIERLISSWDKDSQTSEINRNAGKQPVSVDQELFDLIERSIMISKLTDGAFDISYASMDRIWKFDGSMLAFPSVEKVKESIAKIGYEHIVLDRDDHTVFLNKVGMRIGFGGIGKGYAADKAKALLISEGVQAGIINASGDLNTWGRQPDGQEWKVAITNPMNKKKVFTILPVSDKAIVTSGDYEKYVEFKGERYSHIINPKTGYPCQGILSVSVMAQKAELADALATSIFVMGVETGVDRVNQLPGVECIVVDDTGKVYSSKNIEIEK